jgi:glycosyltransferase involved in cell wall biosynthesis
MAKRIYFMANAVWGDLVGGGDIHFFELARGAVAAGYEVYFFGGPALQKHVAQAGLPVEVILTERRRRPRINEGSIAGQLRMFCDYVERCLRSVLLLGRIRREDAVYSVTDYWCDSLPALLSRARVKAFVFHMEAPTFAQIWDKSRPDVQAGRLASLHYWMSQNLTLQLFAWCRAKHVFYLHPDMKLRLLDLGFHPAELSPISYGVDSAMAAGVAEQVKKYDVCWIGRVHRQKGIDDLLSTIAWLAKRIPGFRALLMGKVESQLRPRIAELGLSELVEFSGFVSELDKLKLFKQSRLFLMPSRHEGSPRVVGEALICGVPVLAYDLPTYRPVFREFAHYVSAFDLESFQREAERQVLASRAGSSYLDALDLADFRRNNSWENTRQVFLEGIQRTEGRNP